MKNYLAALTATALIAVAPFALAASSTELTVTGSITPSACMPMLSGGGNIDLGKIPVKDLNPDPDRKTRLDKQSIGLTVTCDAATQFALDPTDNKAGTATDAYGFGLGLTDAGEKVGEFWVSIDSALADGQPAVAILSLDKETPSWQLGESIMIGAISSVSAAGTLTPLAATEVAMDLVIEPYIAPTNSLTLTDEVTIDGSVTIDVMYL
ncbi:Protein GltF [Pseudomonas fluorescens]|uniref:Protein GltF n=1 Tax=Pseudomonas fluorescens TaxID=294 RepID=A0A5E6XQU4_PSEFL|nr:DUF1120 domain-containing protein [Pseudomonas fluorescens]VVN43570.1 Protein GltF [Pseudomonas fluorescens]